MMEIEKWARKGESTKEIAQHLGVGYSTLRSYVNAKPELAAAIRRGKRQAEKIIRKALASQGNSNGNNPPVVNTPPLYINRGSVSRPVQQGTHRGPFERNKKRIYATQEVCGICGKPVDKSLKYPHPLSPCIDHIVPIAKGGHPSDINNLQLAHWTCNRQKSDKLVDCKSINRSVETISNRILPHSMDWENYRAKK